MLTAVEGNGFWSTGQKCLQNEVIGKLRIRKKYKQNVALHAFALLLKANGSLLAEVLLQQATKGIKKNSLVAQSQQTLKLEGIKSQLDYLKNFHNLNNHWCHQM